MAEIPDPQTKGQSPERIDEVPGIGDRQAQIDEAIAGILELRKRMGKITVAEILSARDEGRR
ncbi:MAG: hypothetical protein ABSH49_22940 [Bryobacteraceae bacterium]|jgi:SLT domain-containing protein